MILRDTLFPRNRAIDRASSIVSDTHGVLSDERENARVRKQCRLFSGDARYCQDK